MISAGYNRLAELPVDRAELGALVLNGLRSIQKSPELLHSIIHGISPFTEHFFHELATLPQSDESHWMNLLEDMAVLFREYTLSNHGDISEQAIFSLLKFFELSGNWQPEDEDKEHKNALVARGYYQAFQAVKKTISDVLQGKNAGEAVKNDHSVWYIQMWMPFAAVGILQRENLVGYRTGQVYIRGSQHIPLNPKAVRDAMPVLFDLLKNEPNSAVRAVLGHFFFVFIHPYMDGNGRMGRFILNVMLASGGYNWTVIPFERRLEYMKALEKASVEGDISDFTKVIASLVK